MEAMELIEVLVCMGIYTWGAWMARHAHRRMCNMLGISKRVRRRRMALLTAMSWFGLLAVMAEEHWTFRN
jgi:hypothetical protein